MTSRRGFLGALGAAIAGATLDPERLLWRPGARVISVPRPLVLDIDAYIDAYITPAALSLANLIDKELARWLLAMQTMQAEVIACAPRPQWVGPRALTSDDL